MLPVLITLHLFNFNAVVFYQIQSCSRKIDCLVILLLLIPNPADSQISPLNIGFETGTFTGWSGATGQCCPVYAPNQGIDTSRHVVTSGNTTDPHSGGLIPVTAHGSVYSARIGNDNNSAESEILDFSFIVPGDSLVLQIHFAVVLQDGLHPASKQPRFSYSVGPASLSLEGCTEELILAGDNYPGKVINGFTELLEWQTRAVSLIGHQGESVSIHFETGDCGPGGHFGYAYVDCELVPAEISASECLPDGSITLISSPNLHGTWNNGSVSDTLIVLSPSIQNEYFLELNADSECAFKIFKNLDTFLPFASYQTHTGCNGNVELNNFSITDAGGLFNWDLGDGNTSQAINVNHQYTNPGDYTIILEVIQPNNCRSLHSEIVHIPDVPEITITLEGMCAGEPVFFNCTNLQGTGSPFIYTWNINQIPVYNGHSAIHTFNQAGLYEISLMAENIFGCVFKETTTFEASSTGDCAEESISVWLPNVFTPNGDGVNDTFGPVSLYERDRYRINIYNRFGQLIFEGSQWNGTYNGMVCPAGNYTYVLTTDFNNSTDTKTGSFLLVR